MDGLAKRIIAPADMVEHYMDRSDFLYLRHVTYEKRTKKQMMEEKDKPRQIVKVVDWFHPNPACPPNSDVAQRTILFVENQIKVVYQLEEGRNIASTRDFMVPPMNPEQAVMLTFDPDTISSYQVHSFREIIAINYNCASLRLILTSKNRRIEFYLSSLRL